MEKNIPTTKIQIGDKEVEIYQWMTQDELDKSNSILMGNIEVDTGGASEVKVSVTMDKMAEWKRFKISSLVKNFKWEQISEWKPKERDLLSDKIDEVIGETEKK
jgi:hypothetical protein